MTDAKPRRPRFLYFDMGNVLLLFDHEIACRQIAELTGLSARRVREIVFDSGLEWSYERGDISSREFYEQFCAVEDRQPAIDDLALAASAIFSLHDPIAQLVRRLKAARWPLGVLSNTCEAHWQYVYPTRFASLWDSFDRFALSYELNSMKPEPAIYAAAAAMAGVAPAEIFFVDDRPENVEQACRSGMDAVLYTTPQQLFVDLAARGVL